MLIRVASLNAQMHILSGMVYMVRLLAFI